MTTHTHTHTDEWPTLSHLAGKKCYWNYTPAQFHGCDIMRSKEQEDIATEAKASKQKVSSPHVLENSESGLTYLFAIL